MAYNFQCSGKHNKQYNNVLSCLLWAIIDHFSHEWFQGWSLAYFKQVEEKNVLTQTAVPTGWGKINSPNEDEII